MNAFIYRADVPIESLAPGLKRQVLGYQNHIMLVKVFFETGTEAPVHQHPHEQMSHVLTGKFRIAIEDTEQILDEGDTFSVAPDLPHSATCLEQGILLDAFSPKRNDFLI